MAVKRYMRPISTTNKQIIDTDPFYRRCCLFDFSECSGRIEIHHNLMWKGRQSDEIWSLLPVCVRHHSMANDKAVRERLDFVMLNRVDNATLSPFCKAVNWIYRKEMLNKIYDNSTR